MCRPVTCLALHLFHPQPQRYPYPLSFPTPTHFISPSTFFNSLNANINMHWSPTSILQKLVCCHWESLRYIRKIFDGSIFSDLGFSLINMIRSTVFLLVSIPIQINQSTVLKWGNFHPPTVSSFPSTSHLFRNLPKRTYPQQLTKDASKSGT